MTRREWIAGLTTCAAATSAEKGGYAPVLAVQAYVWQQQLGREKRSLADGVDEIFASFARAGYRHVELTSGFLEPPIGAKTIAALKRNKLDLPVIYNGGALHSDAEAQATVKKCIEVAEAAKPLGAKALNINCNPKPKRERKSDDELAIQAKAINQLAREIQKRGMRLFIHQHDPEMAENSREWRHILQNTDPKLVDFCLDVHWVLRGKQDPMTLLKECGPRLGSLHLRNSRNGVWLEDLADGEIDYRAVAAYLKSISFRGYLVVELAYDKDTAITRPLADSLKLSREYAQSVFGIGKT
jgi:sugar phosphate isomerase/epimerase